MKRLLIACLIALAACATRPPAPTDDLRVLNAAGGPWMAYVDAQNALYHQMRAEVGDRMRERAAEVAALRTPHDWQRRAEWAREQWRELLYPEPVTTPLHARVAGVYRGDGFRLERVIFESAPGVPVTGALFIPNGSSGRSPGILYLSGHSRLGFRSPDYQRVILNLTRQGHVVFAIDPMGQGERLEYGDRGLGLVDPTLSNTRGHSYVGAQLFLTGGSLAREMTRDAVRALDYLASRPEVDAERLGATGRSGGGTQAAYLAAVDTRVRAVAIENYITSVRRLWDTRGPQDAEQNLPGSVARGLDHADLLFAHAPLPTLLVTTTRDIFSIQGARETYQEARRGFAALGAEEALRMVEDDAAHASTAANRMQLYAFFRETLGGTGAVQDLEMEPIPAAEMEATGTGQAMTALPHPTTFERNREVAEALRTGRRPDGAIDAARRLSGYREPVQEGVVFMGRHRRAGYVIEKYLLEGERVLPFLLFKPDGDRPAPLVIYLDPAGKAARAGPGGDLEWLVRQGLSVAAPDVTPFGEVGPGDFIGDSSDFGERGRAPYGLWFGMMTLNRSLVGEQAADLVRLARHLAARADVDAGATRAIARGELGSALLHAAAFEPGIRRVALIGAPRSFHELATTRDYRPAFAVGGVYGMLREYDLPELAEALGPGRFLAIEPAPARLVRGWDEADEDDLDEYPEMGVREDVVREALREWLAGP